MLRETLFYIIAWRRGYSQQIVQFTWMQQTNIQNVQV